MYKSEGQKREFTCMVSEQGDRVAHSTRSKINPNDATAMQITSAKKKEGEKKGEREEGRYEVKKSKRTRAPNSRTDRQSHSKICITDPR